MKKPVVGMPQYEVDDQGRVFGEQGELSQWLSDSGYLKVGLYHAGKRKRLRVHRLVSNAFIPNPDRKPFVNHKNGDKTDNRVENLEWVTAKENQEHAVVNGLISTGKVEIVAINLKDGSEKIYPSIAKMAKDLGLSHTQARACLSGAKSIDYQLERKKRDA